MPLMTVAFARVHEVADRRRRDQKSRRNQETLGHPYQRDELPGQGRTHDRAQGAAKRHDGEEPLALFLGVDVIGERPELGHDHEIEDTDPEEEHHTDRKLGPGERIEEHQADSEKRGDRVQERPTR
jgi:hypothetical protein